MAFVEAPIYNKAKDVGLVSISPATAPQYSRRPTTSITKLRKHTVPDALLDGARRTPT